MTHDRDSIRGLTLWRPWASLLFVAEDSAHPESPPKLVENRPWWPGWAMGPMVDGIAHARPGKPLWIAIHAGMKGDVDALEWAKEIFAAPGYRGRRRIDGGPITGGLPSLIVGVARLDRVLDVFGLGDDHPEVRRHGPWIGGPYAWELADRTVFAQPIPCKGAQGLWTISPDLFDKMRQQWPATERAQ